ncbi:hypothetical protein ABSA28_00740 [Candidatus Hepatincolaceae symbiont of Richtersius coronifer]
MAKEGFEKIESNEFIQAVYKYTGKSQELSLLSEYHKNKIFLKTLDALYFKNTEIIDSIPATIDSIDDVNYNKKHIKYRKYTKILSGLLIISLGLFFYNLLIN